MKYSVYTRCYNVRRQHFHSTSTTKCYYKTLGLTKEASSKEIKTAYKRLAKEYHPDVIKSDNDNNQSSFVEINEAYSILSDKIKKRRYDLSISKIQQSYYNDNHHINRYQRFTTMKAYPINNNNHKSHNKDNNHRNANKPFWFFVGSLVVLSYGSLWFTGKHFLTKEWD